MNKQQAPFALGLFTREKDATETKRILTVICILSAMSEETPRYFLPALSLRETIL